MRSIVYGPKWLFYSYCEYIGLFGTGICRYCIWVELPIQRRLCPIFVKKCRVTRHSRVFRGLTGSQRTPGFWGVTAWYQSLGIRIPRELGFGYPSPLGGLMWSIGIWKPMDRKFGLRPWLRKSITTRCGLMFGLGMRLPRKSRVNTRTLHARVLCDWIL